MNPKVTSLPLTATFALVTSQEFAEEIKRTNSGCGFHMMEHHTKKMATRHGFTFQLEECLKENNLLSFSRISTIRRNCMGKD